jgi:hypothetical protein
MVASNSTVSADSSSYRVDVVRGEQGDTYHVMNCQKVASFNNPEHATFLVDLLTKGGAHHE